MKYTPSDIERIYRSAISNVEWAEEMLARLAPFTDDHASAQDSLGMAVYHLCNARDEWRKQLNTGDIHGDFPSQRRPVRPGG